MQSKHVNKLKFLILLAIATPGIPEYLSGSWRLSSLVSNPVNFLVFLALNIGLYTSGALLVREFAVTFRKGWFSIFILGCAYGIMEEAIALHTFFQISGSPVGFLGSYGRFAGVDWVWAFGLAIYHAIFSITLPLLLISMAYPELSGKRIIRKPGLLTVVVIYGFSVLFLNFIINRTSSRPVPTSSEYLFFLLFSLVLVAIAYLIPKDLLHFRGKEGGSSIPLFILGLLIYPVYNIFAYIPANPEIVTVIRPVLDILIHLVLFGSLAAAMIHFMPASGNSRHKFALVAGALTSLMLVSVRLELNRTAPLIGIVILIAIVFLYRLRVMVNGTDQGRTGNISQPD